MKKFFVAMVMVVLCVQPAWADHFKFVSLEFPPLEYKGEDGQARGIAVDIVKTIMENLGHTVDISIYPWARALKMTREGMADAIFTAYKNPERETFLDYSKNVLVPQIVAFYVAKDSDINFDGDLMQLKGKKIGIMNTISYGSKFDAVRDQLTTQTVQDIEANYKKLAVGRIDMVISNIYVGDAVLKKMGMQDKFKKLSPAVQAVNSYIAFSKANGLADIRDQFDAELQKLIADGTYDTIMAQYGIRKE